MITRIWHWLINHGWIKPDVTVSVGLAEEI